MKKQIKKRGKVKNAVKNMYKGIKFQSKLELACYKELEINKIDVEYEETTFTIFDGLVYPQACYEGTQKKLYNKGKWIIETKGYANEAFPLRWKLFKKHLKDNNHHYVLFMPRNKKQVVEVVDLIKQL